MKKLDYQCLSTIAIIVINLSFYEATWIKNLLGLFGEKIHIVLSATIMVLIYHLMVYVYNKIFYKFIHRDNYLGGQWIYRIDNREVDCKLYGIFTIEHDMFGVKLLYGKVWDNITGGIAEKIRGEWIGETLSYKDNRLNFIFDHKTLEKLSNIRSSSISDKDNILGISTLNFTRHCGDDADLNGIYYDLEEMAKSKGKWESKRVSKCNYDEHKKLAYDFRYSD